MGWANKGCRVIKRDRALKYTVPETERSVEANVYMMTPRAGCQRTGSTCKPREPSHCTTHLTPRKSMVKRLRQQTLFSYLMCGQLVIAGFQFATKSLSTLAGVVARTLYPFWVKSLDNLRRIMHVFLGRLG